MVASVPMAKVVIKDPLAYPRKTQRISVDLPGYSHWHDKKGRGASDRGRVLSAQFRMAMYAVQGQRCPGEFGSHYWFQSLIFAIRGSTRQEVRKRIAHSDFLHRLEPLIDDEDFWGAAWKYLKPVPIDHTLDSWTSLLIDRLSLSPAHPIGHLKERELLCVGVVYEVAMLRGIERSVVIDRLKKIRQAIRSARTLV